MCLQGQPTGPWQGTKCRQRTLLSARTVSVTEVVLGNVDVDGSHDTFLGRAREDEGRERLRASHRPICKNKF